MSRLSQFEIMRRNRRAAAERTLRERFEVEIDWDTHRQAYVTARDIAGLDTVGWLRETREEIRRTEKPRRRWWQFWKR